MTTMSNQNTFSHIIDIDVCKRKSNAFAKVCELMYVDTNSTKGRLKGKLDFTCIIPDYKIQSVDCTGYRSEHNFFFETNGGAVVEVVEALSKMFPESEIRYYFHSLEEDGVEYRHELYYKAGKVVDEILEDADADDEDEGEDED